MSTVKRPNLIALRVYSETTWSYRTASLQWNDLILSHSVSTVKQPDLIAQRVYSETTWSYRTACLQWNDLISSHSVSTVKRPEFIVFSGCKEQRCGLIIDKYQSHNRKPKNSVVWVLVRTIPTERPPLVGEVSTKFLDMVTPGLI
jgi:hypothetical protein